MDNFISFFILLLISPAVYAQTTHTVGGNSGWNTGVDYSNWAKGQTFAAGDSLLFNYDFTHAVDEVNEDDYKNCNSGNAISSDSNSPTTVSLSAAGTRYFICPRSNHCSQGMKLAVTVGGSGSSPSPPSSGATPSPSSSTTPSSPPPPKGSSATAVGCGKSLLAGSLVVLGGMFGVMG